MSELLHLPVGHGVAAIGVGFLDEAEAALPRIADPADPEGLHDFRVALRRLRSLLRTYDSHVGAAFSKKQKRRLKALAGSTGDARDLEVTACWLEARLTALAADELPGARWWLTRVADARDLAYAELLDGIEERFRDAAGPLRKRLERLRRSGRLQPSLGEATAVILRALSADLRDQLAAVASPWDVETAHQARITGKRVRYLITPFRDICAPCKHAEKSLKGLQDILGDLHDAHVRAEALNEVVAEAAAARARRDLERLAETPDHQPALAPELPGLIAIARHNHRRVGELYAQLRSDWGDGGMPELSRRLEAVAAAMSGGGG